MHQNLGNYTKNYKKRLIKNKKTFSKEIKQNKTKFH